MMHRAVDGAAGQYRISPKSRTDMKIDSIVLWLEEDRCTNSLA